MGFGRSDPVVAGYAVCQGARVVTMQADRRGQSGVPRGLAILGTGRALPVRAVAAAALDRQYGLADGYVMAATGVATRYFCDGESQIDLAVDAARKALVDAQLTAADIDLVISAAAVAYQPIPAMAPAIQRALGIADGACFAVDLNCTCLGFAAALHFAEPLLQAGRHKTILIVSAEVASRGLPWATQPAVAGLFGDGAGAAVVALRPDVGIRAAHFVTLTSAYEACAIGAGGTRFDFEREAEAFAAHSKFAMDGKALFRITAKHFGPFVDVLLDRAATRRDDLACVIAHQASPGALAHMIQICGFRSDHVIDIAGQFGNQIAASIPFALDWARAAGRFRSGDRILILGTSAGVSFGGLVMDV